MEDVDAHKAYNDVDEMCIKYFKGMSLNQASAEIALLMARIYGSEPRTTRKKVYKYIIGLSEKFLEGAGK